MCLCEPFLCFPQGGKDVCMCVCCWNGNFFLMGFMLLFDVDPLYS